MNGWLFLLGFAALAAAMLARWARLPRPGAELAAAALFLAVAGYAWQGSPALPAQPAAPATAQTAREDTAAIETRRRMSGTFGPDQQVIDFADTIVRLGMARSAVTAVQTALTRQPRDADLWVALGNALVAHADGRLTPAARLAYARAEALAPSSPAPRFFLGLALARMGEGAAAAQSWRHVLAQGPADAPWAPDVRARLDALERAGAGR